MHPCGGNLSLESRYSISSRRISISASYFSACVLDLRSNPPDSSRFPFPRYLTGSSFLEHRGLLLDFHCFPETVFYSISSNTIRSSTLCRHSRPESSACHSSRRRASISLSWFSSHWLYVKRKFRRSFSYSENIKVRRKCFTRR